MPDIEFTLDTSSGEFRMHIQGIAGPSCDDIANLVKDLAGTPAVEELTAEYHLRPRVRSATRSQIQPRSRRA
jgi:hypothetical protein